MNLNINKLVWVTHEAGFWSHSQALTTHSKPCPRERCEGEGRHGICHGCTDIIRVKFLFNGVKFFHEHTLFVINSLPVALL